MRICQRGVFRDYFSSLINVVSENNMIATAAKIIDIMKVVVAKIVGPNGRCPVFA